MEQVPYTIFILISVIALNCCREYLTLPMQFQTRGARGRVTDEESYVKISEPKYHLNITLKKDRYKTCFYKIDAYGKGIVDSFILPCEKRRTQKSSNVTSERYLLYGRPTDPLCLFSDEKSTLMVIKDGKCLKVTFATVYTTTYSSENQLSDKDCKELCKKITAVDEDPNYYNKDEEIPIEYVGGSDSSYDYKSALMNAGYYVLQIASLWSY